MTTEAIKAEMTRFTAYLSKKERSLLEERAEELDTSANYILRLAVRQFFGLDKPRQV